MSKSLFAWKSPEEKILAFRKAKELAERNPTAFWGEEALRLCWSENFHSVHNEQFIDAKWFMGGKLNASVNCLDRHVQEKGDKIAIICENEQGDSKEISYKELLALTKDIATILLERGIKAGDRVAIYMPMTAEAIASMLACARIGAIHTVVFGGFSSHALAERVFDAEAKAIITAEESFRKGQKLHLRAIVEEALADTLRSETVTTVLVFGLKQECQNDRMIAFKRPSLWPLIVEKPESFDAEHPLFILYTSGTTGKPKGLFHSTGGYLTQVASTTKWVFDLNDNDRYWCTADIGWITGHSYIVYGPLALGGSIFIYDGALNWPDSSRIYRLIEKHKITVFYTAPTAIRMFMQAGEEQALKFSLTTLRLLGSVGEPINPKAWCWYRQVFGHSNSFVIDSWWQTETGAMMITPLEYISTQKPGSASKPFLGISAKVVDDEGVALPFDHSGFLVIDKPWPSMARGIWKDQERFIETYFKKFSGSYFTADGAKIDTEGDFTISGRIDDVVNVSGHRLGTAEIESALLAHASIAEAAVVGVADQLTGQRLEAFVVLKNEFMPSEALKKELSAQVKTAIGSFAKPAAIYFEKTLPKTRSGKIMRRLLRAKASGEPLPSDISTLDRTTFN